MDSISASGIACAAPTRGSVRSRERRLGRALIGSLGFLPLLAAAPAFAQQADTPAPATTSAQADADALNKDMVTLAIGGAWMPDYEGSKHDRVTPVPAVRASISGMTFTVAGNTAWADLIPDHGTGWDLQAGPLLELNLDRWKKPQDARVAALGKINPAFEAGAQVGIGYRGLITSDYDELSVSVGYLHDVGTVNRSEVITPAISYTTPLSHHALVNFTGSADYAGSGYMRTYFGVTPGGSAASGLPVYTPGKGWKDWSATALGDISLTGDLTHGLQLIGGVAYRRLTGDAARSPLVSIAGSRNQWTGGLGLAYTF